MRKVITAIMLVAFLSASGVCFSGNVQTLNIGATIDPVAELSMWIRAITPGIQAGEADEDVDPFATDGSTAKWEGGSLDFGTYVWDEKETENDKGQPCVVGWLKPERYFCVLLSARTQGKPYKITQECSAAGLEKTLLLTADYRGEDLLGEDPQSDDGPLENFGVIPNQGVKQFAVGTKDIFDASMKLIGKPRIVRCWYGMASGKDDEPEGVVPVDYIEGRETPYTGTIKYTLTTN